MALDKGMSIVWISNSSTDIYPHNSLTRFTNELPREIREVFASGVKEWEMALHSVTFASQFRMFNAEQLNYPIMAVFEGVGPDHAHAKAVVTQMVRKRWEQLQGLPEGNNPIDYEALAEEFDM